MKKKVFLGGAMLLALTFGLVGMSAFEAHIINVTATLENALTVDTTPIHFGTVFPQEEMFESFNMALSKSFMATDRVDDIEYMIRQKPKCWSETDQAYGRVTEDREGNFICLQSETAKDYTQLPLLCPFLSKHEITVDGQDVTGADNENDSDGINAFHGPTQGWDMGDTIQTQVLGRLAKSEDDIDDTWEIDFRVPCFGGQCAQDWDEFVERNNSLADPEAYILPTELEHELFGCDLWVEVTEVSTSTNELGCTDKPDLMLVLDRSNSIDSGELSDLQDAAKSFVTALSPASDGAHVGQSSFGTDYFLDQELTSDQTLVEAAIDALATAGNTHLEGGIITASVELSGLNDRLDGESPDFMVIITDGAPTASDGPGTHEEDAAAAALAARNAGTTIYVVGVGTTADTEDFLKDEIASSPAHYFPVSDYASLQAELESLTICDAR